MTAKRTFAFPRRIAPEFCMNIRLLKTEGAVLPQEGSRECRALDALAAARAKVESTQASHHGHAGITRHSPRDGFNGFLRALPGDRAFLPPSPRRAHIAIIANLTPASGRQDHTASPSASAPFVRTNVCAACFRVHRIPSPTFVTIAKRPFCVGRDGETMEVIWVKREGAIFLHEGLDSKSVICPTTDEFENDAPIISAIVLGIVMPGPCAGHPRLVGPPLYGRNIKCDTTSP